MQFLDSSVQFVQESCLLKKTSPMLWPRSSLPVPHSNYKQNRTKEILQPPSTTPCIVGVAVVMVVVKPIHPSLSLKGSAEGNYSQDLTYC